MNLDKTCPLHGPHWGTELSRCSCATDDRNDIGRLGQVALTAIRAAMHDGATGRHQYEPGHWLTVPVLEHVQHAVTHATEATNGEWIGTAAQRRAIEHAICILSFALSLLDREGEAPLLLTPRAVSCYR